MKYCSLDRNRGISPPCQLDSRIRHIIVLPILPRFLTLLLFVLVIKYQDSPIINRLAGNPTNSPLAEVLATPLSAILNSSGLGHLLFQLQGALAFFSLYDLRFQGLCLELSLLLPSVRIIFLVWTLVSATKRRKKQ